MKRLSKPHPSQPNFNWDEESPARTARLRMVQLPTDSARDPKTQFLFPREELWVPVAVVNGNVHILPGIPSLCTSPFPLTWRNATFLTQLRCDS